MNNARKALPTGGVIDLENPSNYNFSLGEIAALLDKVIRFNGWGVNVARHSIAVAEAALYCTGNPHFALRALFHDAAEAYTGDIGTPVKYAVGTAWDNVEHRVQTAIEQQLGIMTAYNHATNYLVKYLDYAALKVEATLLGFDLTIDEWSFFNTLPVSEELWDVLESVLKEEGSAKGAFVFFATSYKSSETPLTLASLNSPWGEFEVYIADGFQTKREVFFNKQG